MYTHLNKFISLILRQWGASVCPLQKCTNLFVNILYCNIPLYILIMIKGFVPHTVNCKKTISIYPCSWNEIGVIYNKCRWKLFNYFWLAICPAVHKWDKITNDLFYIIITTLLISKEICNLAMHTALQRCTPIFSLPNTRNVKQIRCHAIHM